MIVKEANCFVVPHREGDTEAGKALCNELSAAIKGSVHQVVHIFHDAADMTFASAGYRDAFLEFEKQFGDRVASTVCYIPSALPRMLAKSVALITGRNWQIVKSKEEFYAILERMLDSEQNFKAVG